jgi:uncharacterized protein YlxW (UPF0749 family)
MGRLINMIIKNKLSVLLIGFMLMLSFSAANAEGLTLEEAYNKIELLKNENESLKVQLTYFEKEIASYREKLESYDNKESSEE